MSDKKRTFGPSGSQFSDDYMEYYIRIKVPMPRFDGTGMDAETFKEMLEKSDKTAIKQSLSAVKRSKEEMSKEEFMRILSDPTAPTKRKLLSAKRRMANALIYHSTQDERFWEDQQMEILKWLEGMRYDAKLATWRIRRRILFERVEKRHKQLAKKNPAIAKSFAQFAWDYAESSRPQNPKDRQPASLVIIRQVQRMAIRRQTAELATLTEQLGPLISNKPIPKKKPKAKRKRKKKPAVPKGKTPIEDIFPDKKE